MFEIKYEIQQAFWAPRKMGAPCILTDCDGFKPALFLGITNQKKNSMLRSFLSSYDAVRSYENFQPSEF